MFYNTPAFDQDLGWCVAEGVSLGEAFSSSGCEATSCGVVQMDNCPITGYVMDDDSIRTAVAAWFADQSAAEATYGHISTWATGWVTDMRELFCGASWEESCNSAAASFNRDIGAWDTSGVTTMYGMFDQALAFNQDLGWCVD